jgi:CBS domain-containing protein
MNVSDICKRNVVTIHPKQTLVAAIELMREKHIGYLIVTDSQTSNNPQTPVGVLTDRDIVVGVLARGADVRGLSVDEVMTRKPVVVHDNDAVRSALKEMRRIGARRLPVVDSNGQLAGVLALDDIFASIAEFIADAAEAVQQEQRLESALRP